MEKEGKWLGQPLVIHRTSRIGCEKRFNTRRVLLPWTLAQSHWCKAGLNSCGLQFWLAYGGLWGLNGVSDLFPPVHVCVGPTYVRTTLPPREAGATFVHSVKSRALLSATLVPITFAECGVSIASGACSLPQLLAQKRLQSAKQAELSLIPWRTNYGINY